MDEDKLEHTSTKSQEADAILNRSVGWKANGEFWANPLATPTLDDIFMVEEAAVLLGFAHMPPALEATRRNYSEKLRYDEYKQNLKARADELESVVLNCTTCGEVITEATVLRCDKCKTLFRWISGDSSIAILSLQRQLYSLAEQLERREHRKKRGYSVPLENFLDVDLPKNMLDKSKMLILEIKSRIKDNGKDAVKIEGMSCPSCGGPLSNPYRCSYCQSLIVYSDMSFDVLNRLDD